MVSDAMAKIVFLPVPVSGGFFPVRKVGFRLFFTVKHFFLKIKLWLKEIGTREVERKRSNHEETCRTRSRPGHHRRPELGLGRSIHLDLVAAVLGMKFGETSAFSTVVYSLVGLAGLYQALTWKSIQRRWHGDLAGARA